MRKRLLPVVFSALLALGLSATAAYADTGVAIVAQNFPDDNFRTVVAGFDANSDGTLSDAEIAAVTKIETSGHGIHDMTGIEHFTALEELSCYENFTKLDLSKNRNLKKSKHH